MRRRHAAGDGSFSGRRTGLAKMTEVYAWEMPGMPGEYFALTADHLFGRIWSRPGLSMRDKRLMTPTVVTAVGEKDLAEIQVNAALHNGELTEDELREMARFITHYVGFPRGSGLNAVVEKVIAKRTKAAAAGAPALPTAKSRQQHRTQPVPMLVAIRYVGVSQ